ncbi:MAG: hypothetical protein HZC03_00155 [Candidatus Lloydbacteria bacterium]|nr:hypothetical protein [Candidatus Lloydbacteria bacterium]
MTTITQHLYTTEHIEKKAFWALSFLAMVFIALYIYFVASATVAIVDRERIENAIAVTGGALSSTESKYLSLSSNITPELIHSLGFREITDPHFVSRTGLAFSAH